MALDAGAFARKLRNSKPIRHPGHGLSIPPTITSHSGWRQKDEYGLKQSLPMARRGSPYIKITSHDNEWARPDWTPTTAGSLFVGKWEESGLTANPDMVSGIARQPPMIKLTQFEPATMPTADGLVVLAERQKRIRTASPDFTWLNDEDFERYLDKLRDLRPAFIEYSKRHDGHMGVPRASTSQVMLEDDEQVADVGITQAERGRTIINFLTEHSEELSNALSPKSDHQARQNSIDAKPHPLLGLNYAPYSQMHNFRFSEPIPGRVLAKAVAANKHGYVPDSALEELEHMSRRNTRYSTSVMGVVGELESRRRTGTGVTQWLPNQDGFRNEEAGKGHFHIIDAQVNIEVKPDSTHWRSRNSVEWPFENFGSHNGGHRALMRESTNRELEPHPGAPSTGIRDTPIKLELREVHLSTWIRQPKVGSAAYVMGHAAPVTYTAGLTTEHAAATDVIDVWAPDTPQHGIANPTRALIQGITNKDRKAQRRREAAAFDEFSLRERRQELQAEATTKSSAGSESADPELAEEDYDRILQDLLDLHEKQDRASRKAKRDGKDFDDDEDDI